MLFSLTLFVLALCCVEVVIDDLYFTNIIFLLFKGNHLQYNKVNFSENLEQKSRLHMQIGNM